MRRAAQPRPHKRNGFWYLVRRVPAEFADLDRRGIVFISTEIPISDDPRGIRATATVKRLSAELDAYWRGRKDGQSGEARLRYEQAVKRARALGLPYQTAAELAAGPLDEILKRIQLLSDRNALDDEQEVAAVVGGEERPGLRLSDLVATVARIQSVSLADMSEKQRHRWGLPKLKAVANFTEVLGIDKELLKLTREDALQMRIWLQNRVLSGEVGVGTANKDIQHLSKMLNVIENIENIGIRPVFKGLRLEGEKEKTRAPFAEAFARDVIFTHGALDGLNAEARAIVFLLPNTGLRPSEAANLLPHRIVLQAEVPHIQIRADNRKLKTPQSERDIPLVGMALWVMQQFPGGFPRYQGNEDSLSAAANKYLKQHGMLPSDDHSLYSFRHSFEDRLTAVEAPDRIAASLMGHKWHRPRYGAGPSLKQLEGWLGRIAFPAPKHFGPRG